MGRFGMVTTHFQAMIHCLVQAELMAVQTFPDTLAHLLAYLPSVLSVLARRLHNSSLILLNHYNAPE
jgi:hypothetical protein